jgi:hypothetical protein
MKKVSDAMLKSVCGGSHYWNPVTNVCTSCPVGLISAGSGCICNQTAGYIINSVTNLCTRCPVGSSSTGSRCICVGKGIIWDSRTNVCIEKKKVYKDFLFIDL